MSTKTIREPMVMVPGPTYKGSAKLTEYGEVIFTAYQKGAQDASRMTEVIHATQDDWSWKVSHSKNRIKIELSMIRGDKHHMADVFRSIFLKSLREIETRNEI